MVVAVAAMGKVQMPCDHIVHMIAMWNGLVTATSVMVVAGLMPVAGVGRGAGRGILTRDGERMLVNVVAMNVVQVTIMKVIGMTVMRHGLVAATGPVPVSMIVMNRVGAHHRTPSVRKDET